MQFRSSLKPYTIWINWVLANAHGLNRKSVLPLHVRLASPRVVCRKCDRRGKTSDVAEITELCRLYEK